jgi:hypothetical protein
MVSFLSRIRSSPMNNYDSEHQGGLRAGEVPGEGPAPHAARPALPLTIEGSKEEVGREIAELGPEGKPANPKAGPGLLAIELGIAAVLLGVVALVMGLWLGWPAGIALFVIAMMGLAFNPAALATLFRMKDRKTIANRHTPDEPRVRVVRSSDIERHAT